MGTKIAATPLELVKESKIAALLSGKLNERHEASGIHFKDGFLYIVFDNDPYIVRLKPDLSSQPEDHQVIYLREGSVGYEDLTYQPFDRRWYCLLEALEYRAGEFRPRIDEFDEEFHLIAHHWLEFPLARSNKGIEGLTTLRYRGDDYLLGLCEGNDCQGGKAGRTPGNGRIQVFRRDAGEWRHFGTIRLPASIPFEDYSSLALNDRFITVISQVTSAMWVGKVRQDATSLDTLFEDAGHLYTFPRDEEGRIIYCNLEGVTWIGDGELAAVSDRSKAHDQPGRCERKDQSVHIFKLPDSLERPG
jgi:hypothetical protein